MKIQIVGELELRILSKTGELERLYKRPVDSLLANYTRKVSGHWANSGFTLYDTTNTPRSLGVGVDLMVIAPEASHMFGILVGTGTNPVTISDYNLQTKILHGNGAGQLYHQITEVSASIIVGNECYFNVSRNFNNNSGSTITIWEAGIVGYPGVGTNYYLIARDLTGAIDVLTTKTLATLYTFKVTA